MSDAVRSAAEELGLTDLDLDDRQLDTLADAVLQTILPADILQAIAKTDELAGMLRRLCGKGVMADHDWAEFANLIHSIQARLIAQIAARAFPDRFRPLGETIGP